MLLIVWAGWGSNSTFNNRMSLNAKCLQLYELGISPPCSLPFSKPLCQPSGKSLLWEIQIHKSKPNSMPLSSPFPWQVLQLLFFIFYFKAPKPLIFVTWEWRRGGGNRNSRDNRMQNRQKAGLLYCTWERLSLSLFTLPYPKALKLIPGLLPIIYFTKH